MINLLLLLLDVRLPEPSFSGGVGLTELILVGIAVLMLTAAGLLGLVFLIKVLRRRGAGAGTRVMVGDVCLNMDSATARSSSPTETNN